LKSAPDEHGKIARAHDIWRERSTATFVDTYRATVADHLIWPSNAKRAERVLDFFLLEKAFYEIGYELAHRPEWLRVPLAGILKILAKKREAT
jgi:maltose alpha-D-glucosyltransferase/alpha-amylase